MRLRGVALQDLEGAGGGLEEVTGVLLGPPLSMAGRVSRMASEICSPAPQQVVKIVGVAAGDAVEKLDDFLGAQHHRGFFGAGIDLGEVQSRLSVTYQDIKLGLGCVARNRLPISLATKRDELPRFGTVRAIWLVA